MFDVEDARYMGAVKASLNKTEWNCPVCQEPITYYPPDIVGYCSCGYCTEE